MTSESGSVAYWQHLNEIMTEADESYLVSTETHDVYRSRLSCEDALIMKLFGTEQSAPRDLADAFDKTFGRA